MTENLALLVFLVAPFMFIMFALTYIQEVKTQQGKRTVRSLVIGNTLVLLFLVSLCTLFGEIYFRFIYDSTDSFALCKTTDRWFKRHYIRNRTGFRDSYNYLPTLQGDQHRFSFVGDSFTAGHGIKNVEDRFANRIRSMRPDYEIHVLAECGFDSGKEIELIEFLPQSGYETDTVVLVYCLNDVADIHPKWNEVLDRIYDQTGPGPIISSSYLFDTMYARWRIAQEPEIKNYYRFVKDGYEGEIWRQQQQRLKECRNNVSKRDVQLMVVTFPFLHELGADYPYESVHQKLTQFWDDLDVPHLDLLSTFRDLDSSMLVVSPWDAHPNEKAHELAAQAIAEFLDGNLSDGKQRK